MHDGGAIMATISKKDRIFIIGSGIALMLGGAAVLVALSAAEVSKHDFGVIGMMCLATGIILLAEGFSLFLGIYNPVRENAASLKALKTLCTAITVFSLILIAGGSICLYFS